MTSTIPAYVPTSLEKIEEIYTTLNARFDSLATHSLAYRLYNLKQLAYMIQDNEERIQEAVGKDLGKGAFDVSFGDLWPIINEINLALKRVEGWMKDEWRIKDAMFSFKSMRPRVKKQPKGVALIISTWNYPWQLALNPLIGAIAAGCPAVIKASEHAPSSAALLAEIMPRYLDPEGYAVVVGAVDETTRLLEKPWGHILYTGSAGIGQIVAHAAVKTLTPTTLELGGKSPVVVSSCANLKIAARRMFSIKQMTAGQICIAPDYVLVVKDRVDEFIAECRKTLDEMFPPSPSPLSTLHASSASNVRNSADLDRMMTYVSTAEEQGKLIYKGEVDKSTRRMGISLIRLNENAEGETGGIVKEEIFGPVMSIIPVENVDAAIKYINDRPRPLALYVCSGNRSVFEKILNETWSGSATWNDFAFATVARNLPFGGVGASGWDHITVKMGSTRLHTARLSLRCHTSSDVPSIPPMAGWKQTIFKLMLFSGVSFRRPTSVEGEAKRLQRKKVISWLSGALLLAVSVYAGALGIRAQS